MIVFIFAFSTACKNKQTGPTSAYIVIHSNPAQALEQQMSPFQYPDTAVLTEGTIHTFTVSNVGPRPAVLQEVSNTTLGITSPFELVTNSQSAIPNCNTGTVLNTNESCVLTIRFIPIDTQNYSQNFFIHYLADNESIERNEVRQASLNIRGLGYLDCSVTPQTQDGYEAGISAAENQMIEDALRGTADGKALTIDDGLADGYNDGYSEAYNNAYDGPNGYPLGYDDGYEEGLFNGLNNNASCIDGQNAAQTQGYQDGLNDGDFDGYEDGYSDGEIVAASNGYGQGYDDGYPSGSQAGYAEGASDGASQGYNNGYDDAYDSSFDDGYSDGYSDGANSCFSNINGLAFATSTVPEKFINQCYDQGYEQTYSTQAYWDAYNTAKANNIPYQNGYTQGHQEGVVDGREDGEIDGYLDGYTQGLQVGFNEGSDIVYQECYHSRYPVAYSNGYDDGYENGYSDGFDDGYNDQFDSNYNIGYDDGYDDGYSDNYQDGVNAEYDDAYDDGYNDGDIDGYWAGYDDGYDDGSWEYCLNKVAVRTSSSLKKTRFKLREKTVRRKVSDRTPITGVHPKSSYGKGKNWWISLGERKGKLKNKPSIIPPSIKASLSQDQIDDFKSQRSLNKRNSLRSYKNRKMKKQKIHFSKRATERKSPRTLPASMKEKMEKSREKAKENNRSKK